MASYGHCLSTIEKILNAFIGSNETTYTGNEIRPNVVLLETTDGKSFYQLGEGQNYNIQYCALECGIP